MGRGMRRPRSNMKKDRRRKGRPNHTRRRRRGPRFANRIALMRDLYKRLRAIGFDEKFIRERVLPDWWDDSLGTVPSNRALAEAAIARALALPVGVLRDPSASLRLP